MSPWPDPSFVTSKCKEATSRQDENYLVGPRKSPPRARHVGRTGFVLEASLYQKAQFLFAKELGSDPNPANTILVQVSIFPPFSI